MTEHAGMHQGRLKKSWQDLLEFGNFIDVENKIHKLVADSAKQEN